MRDVSTQWFPLILYLFVVMISQALNSLFSLILILKANILGMMGLHARAMLAIMVNKSMPTWGLVQKLQQI